MPNGKQYTDHFIQAFQQGEEHAYDYFFREYYPALCCYANRYMKDMETARDIVQDCFTKLWERHTDMARAATMKSFLYTIVRNECLYRIRTNISTNKKAAGFNYLQDGKNWDPADADNVISSETIARLYKAIETLPPKMQRVFKLHYIEGKKIKEIAQLLNSSYDTVRQQRARAIQILKGRMLLLLFVIVIAYTFSSNYINWRL